MPRSYKARGCGAACDIVCGCLLPVRVLRLKDWRTGGLKARWRGLGGDARRMISVQLSSQRGGREATAGMDRRDGLKGNIVVQEAVEEAGWRDGRKES